jgi:signal transduction histidine kinase
MESSSPSTVTETLCANFSEGLHAIAQPLTILLSSLCDRQLDQMSMGEYRELISNSAVEVERVRGLFSCLQQFVKVESFMPVLSAVSIRALFEEMADGVNLIFEKEGMLLHTTVSDDCDVVLIDRARTIQALSTVLLIALKVSRPSDTIELAASPACPDMARIIVRNSRSDTGTLTCEARLSMALAEANIRSQQSGFSWELQPFNVQIELQEALANRGFKVL